MLGGLLSRQEEEEERQLLQAEQQAASLATPDDAGAARGSLPSHSQYGSLGGAASDAAVGARYEGEYEDHSDLAGDYSYDSGEDSELDSGDDDDGSYPGKRRGNQKRGTWRESFRRIGAGMRKAASAIADVDNVWDSPDHARRDHGVAGAYAEDPSADGNAHMNDRRTSTIMYNVITGGTATRNRTAAIFWFIFLFTSYASERSTFKLLVDRVVPFRLFSAELILGAHALLTGLGMLIGKLLCKSEEKGFQSSETSGFGLGLPLADVGLMAVLDTAYLLLGVISGAHVPPVLTVILVQTTIPLTACFTQCVHPDGRCSGRGSAENEEASGTSPASATNSHSNVHIVQDSALGELQSDNDVSFPDDVPSLPASEPVQGWGGLSKYHIFGTGMMFLAIFLGLTPAVLSLDHIIITKKDAMPERTAYNTIVFCLAAVPAAMSQLYKEHTMTRLKQPIDRNTLNLVLSIFQLLFAIVVSPLAYGLQGMGDGPGWTTLYPSKSIGENFAHGLACFLGTLDEETQKTGYPEEAVCSWSWALIIGHVLSIIMVGVAIDKLAAATKVMYRGVSMGILVSVLLMFIYQIRDQWCEYGPLVSFFHLSSTAVLIVGAEIYHRVSLVDASFETTYPVIGDLYEEEE
ncbi:hypothetical protein ACHAXT_004854 [Thalassiosira profunda]